MAGIQEYEALIRDIGKAGANALFPNDFEYYVVTLELVDSNDRTIEFLSFPVSPEVLTYDNVPVTTIKKTLGGVNSTSSSTFNPRQISLQGTFGRKFRLLIGSPNKNNILSPYSTQQGFWGSIERGVTSIKNAVFDPKIKRGYGVTKLLEAIVEKSKGLDDKNEPMRLFFYNPALGHSFLVKPGPFQLSQNRDSSNMMWRYSLQLTAIAPLNRIESRNARTSLLKSTSIDALQGQANRTANELKQLI